MATRKDKPEETTEDTTETTDENTVAPTQPGEVGGHWEDDDTTGDRRWIPDEPEPPQ